jgi:hypothetical protein
MFDPALVGVISAATALVASIAGPLVTLYMGRAQIRAAVRSANRQKWIEEFRDMIAHFCGQVATVAASVQVRGKVIRDGRVAIPAQREVIERFERLVFTSTKIRLMINPLEHEHQELLKVIGALLMRFRTASITDDVQAEADATVQRIVDISLNIIRHEWLRVKKGG